MITGITPAGSGVDALVDELSEHLRAMLRDALCGHLDADLCAVAEDLLVEAAAVAGGRAQEEDPFARASVPVDCADAAPEGPPGGGFAPPVRAR